MALSKSKTANIILRAVLVSALMGSVHGMWQLNYFGKKFAEKATNAATKVVETAVENGAENSGTVGKVAAVTVAAIVFQEPIKKTLNKGWNAACASVSAVWKYFAGGDEVNEQNLPGFEPRSSDGEDPQIQTVRDIPQDIMHNDNLWERRTQELRRLSLAELGGAGQEEDLASNSEEAKEKNESESQEFPDWPEWLQQLNGDNNASEAQAEDEVGRSHSSQDAPNDEDPRDNSEEPVAASNVSAPEDASSVPQNDSVSQEIPEWFQQLNESSSEDAPDIYADYADTKPATLNLAIIQNNNEIAKLTGELSGSAYVEQLLQKKQLMMRKSKEELIDLFEESNKKLTILKMRLVPDFFTKQLSAMVEDKHFRNDTRQFVTDCITEMMKQFKVRGRNKEKFWKKSSNWIAGRIKEYEVIQVNEAQVTPGGPNRSTEKGKPAAAAKSDFRA